MLQIYINNKQVDLAEDTSITLVWENSFFTPDEIIAPYSFSWNIPRSECNISIIGYADRVGGRISSSNMPCRIVFDGIELATGSVTIDSIGKDGIECSFVSGDILLVVGKKLYELPLGRVSFGTATSAINSSGYKYWDTTSVFKEYKTYWRKAEQNTLSDLSAPTMVLKDSKWPDKSSDRFLQNCTHAYRNDMRINTFGNYGYGTDVGNYAKILPSVRLAYIMNRIHSSLGEAFNTKDVRHMILCASYHPAYRHRSSSIVCSIDEYTKEFYIDIADLMPNMNTGDFVCDCLKIICSSIYIVGGTAVVASRSSVLTSAASIDITRKVIGEPEFSVMHGQKYQLHYASSDTEDTIEEDLQITPVGSVRAMVDGSSTDTSTAGLKLRTFKITTTGQVFEMHTNDKLSTGELAHVEYKLLRSNEFLNPTSEQESESFDVSIGITPLKMVVGTDIRSDSEMLPSFDSQNATRHSYMYMPEIEVSEGKRPDSAYVSLIYAGVFSFGWGDSFRYPFCSSDSRNADGTKLQNFSMEIDGPHGLRKTYHREFADWVERDKRTIDLDVLLAAVDLHRIDLRRKLHYAGINFLTRKLSVTIKPQSISPARIEGVEC